MKPVTELDKAALKHEMRVLYKDIGITGSFQVIYELIVAVEMMLDVISEENTKHEQI